jgi:hypothetical protein
VRRASESLSVLRQYDQQRRTRCGAWCEERARAASPAASLRAKGCVIICPINREKQRGDVKRAVASARTSEHDRASVVLWISSRSPTASHSFAVLAPASQPAFSPLNAHYRYNRKKYTPAIIQMINKPQMREEVRPLTSKIPILKRIVPIVSVRSFFIAKSLHQSHSLVWVISISSI